MSITVNFAGASLDKPGSYSDLKVADASVSTPSIGVVAIIGESDAGTPFSQEKGLSAVTFGPDELQAIKDKFGAGPLVDAAKLAITPSNDPQIRGGAQELVLLKTNLSTKSSLAIKQSAATYGTLSDKKGGAAGNNLSYSAAIASGKATLTVADLTSGQSEVSAPLGGNALLTIQCTDGTATVATVSISATALTTTVTGGTAAQPLNAILANFASVGKLVEFISGQPGYSASVATAALSNKPVSRLDQVSSVSILTAASVNQDAAEVRDFFASSRLVNFTPALFLGLPSAAAKTFLAGGAKGGTNQAAIQDCLDALMKRRVNFVTAMFSRDAAADIAENLTDAASTYSINSILAAVSSHVNEASTVKGRKERQAFVGFKGTLDQSIERAAVLNNNRVSLLIQDVDVLGADGVVSLQQPHMLAAIDAGMHAAAAIGLPVTYKAPAVSGFHHVDFDAETMASKAIKGNITFLEVAPAGGFRFVLDNSTYAADKDAWIYNRPSVVYAGDFAAYAIRLSTEQFVGQRNSDVSVETIKNLLVGVMDSLRGLGVIVADTKTAGKGYKDLSVKIEGSIVRVGVTLALVEGFEFILSEIKVQRAG